MALDLSFKPQCSPTPVKMMVEDPAEMEDDNNNSMSAINLSIPKEGRLGGEDEPSSPTQLSPHQIQLDIAALNLLCLARLQETAAVLTGRRPLPAHMSSTASYPLVTSNNNRRNHKCDEPGCDKVMIRNQNNSAACTMYIQKLDYAD